MSGNTPPRPARAGAGLVGVGAAACVACCTGPILGALGAIGLASAAGYVVAGTAALAIGVLAAVAVVVRRRRRARSCVPAGTTAPVAAPTLRPRPAPTADDRTQLAP